MSTVRPGLSDGRCFTNYASAWQLNEDLMKKYRQQEISRISSTECSSRHERHPQDHGDHQVYRLQLYVMPDVPESVRCQQ